MSDSLVSQGDDGIDVRGATGGHVDRDKRCRAEREENQREQSQVAVAGIVEHRREQPTEPRCSDEAEGQTRTNEPHALAQNQGRYRFAPRAERDANADFARSLRDDLGEHAVASHQSEHQRETRERCRQPCPEARIRERFRDFAFDRSQFANRNLRIE
jgi:hypothetical protein